MEGKEKIQKLTFVRETKIHKQKRYGLFLCSCGNTKETIISAVKSNKIISCGCAKKNPKKHGLSYNPIYAVWRAMKNRCYSPKNKEYKNYGGRGISVCMEWLSNPQLFIDWCLQNGYKEGLELDRAKNSGNYEPGNCRFVTSLVNNNNTRKNVLLSLNGKTQSVAIWARELKIEYDTLKNRIDLGWSDEKALTTPVNMKFSFKKQIANAFG